MNGQSPGDYISEEQIRQRMQIITPYTKWIRTFTSTGGIEASGKIAHELNLKIAMGAWLDSDNSTNQIEMENLIEAAKDGYVDIAIIGSEVLLRNALNESKLIEYINQFKNEVPWIPVTYGDVYSELISHPNVIDACSIIFANYYPYWEGIHIEDALANLHGQHEKMMEAANGKEVWVSETGWPSDGATINEAVPSLENACSYFLNFASWAQAEKVNYLYFEAFDEAWKANGGTEQEAHWGIWDQYGNLKEGMEEVFLGETTEDNWTCALLVGNPNLDPEIGLTFVPEIGSSLNLTGFASNLIPKYYRIAVYIRVGGGWWTKPYWSSPATLIGCDGNWVCDITTGGHDGSADAIAAFLIPVFYSPPAMPVAGGGATLPLELETNSLDSIIVYRE
jgi:exo-beta-1,3-glucanase (GH17 family)